MGAQLPEGEAARRSDPRGPPIAEPARAGAAGRATLDLIIPGALIGLILFLCFVWPLFGTVPKPTGGNILDANAPVVLRRAPLGTDQVGNDLWSRLLYGGRNSLEIAFAVNLIGLVLGGLLGAFAAFWGSFIDTVIMRVLDVLIAFPSLVLALAIAQSLGPSKLHTIYALCFFSVPAFARSGPGRRRCACASGRSCSPRGWRARARRGSCCATSRPTSCPSSSPSGCWGWA